MAKSKKRVTKSYTEKFKAKVLQEHASGVPIAKLSKAHGLHVSTVYGWIKARAKLKKQLPPPLESRPKPKPVPAAPAAVAVPEDEVRVILKWYKKDVLTLDNAVKALLG